MNASYLKNTSWIFLKDPEQIANIERHSLMARTVLDAVSRETALAGVELHILPMVLQRCRYWILIIVHAVKQDSVQVLEILHTAVLLQLQPGSTSYIQSLYCCHQNLQPNYSYSAQGVGRKVFMSPISLSLHCIFGRYALAQFRAFTLPFFRILKTRD